MNTSISLTKMFSCVNPGSRSIRVNTIVPMTQKVVSDSQYGDLHIVTFPDIHPDNYIFNSFLGGDVVLGKENGVENCILIGNGQVIKFGRYNSLQNLEAHGSDIREIGVEWGDGNFIAHRAIFHGCKGGDRNYLGVGNIIADLSSAGSENYFYHGSTVGFNTTLRSHRAYKGSYITNETESDLGPSENAIEFENQRTKGRISLGELFHDTEFKFMRNIIVPRTKNLLAHLAYTLGGYVENKVGKQPAKGVPLHHVLSAGEYFCGIFSKLIELVDKAMARDITNIQNIYSLLLDGTRCKEDIERIEDSWANRHEIYRKGFMILENLMSKLGQKGVNDGYPFHFIDSHPQKRFPEYQNPQRVILLDFGNTAIPHVIKTKQDLLTCQQKITEAEQILAHVAAG